MRNSCSFVFYESVWKQYQILDARRPEAAKAFMRAVIEYGLYDIVPPEDDEVWMYGLEQTITSIDAAKGRREKNQEDGSKGGRPAIRFERELIEQKKQELKTWKAVAEFLGIDEKTLRKIRSNWEEEEKTGKTEKPEIPVNTGKNLFPVSPILDEENNETGKTDGKNGKNGKNVGKTENGKNLNVNVNVTEKQLMKVVPQNYWSEFHYLLVLFGRYFCTARKPNCENCKLKDCCKYYNNKSSINCNTKRR